MADIPSFTLNNGTKMPSVGLGCWMGSAGGGSRVYDMVTKALKIGYRHFDTAAGYGNEEEVGKAIKDSGIPREEIFITTKLAMTSYSEVAKAFEASVKALGVDYVDLYLVHWPQAFDGNGKTVPPEEHPTIHDVWKDMEDIYETGKSKAIGVSNYSIKILRKLLTTAKIVPAVNQVEAHPCLPYHDLKAYCESKGVLMTAYSSLGRPPSGQGPSLSVLAAEPAVQDVIARYEGKVTPAQVLLSWGVHRGTVVIPKSENEERLRTNITLIRLSDEEMEALNNVHKKPNMHKSLLTYHKPDGTVFGWTYEQLGWPMTVGGIVKE